MAVSILTEYMADQNLPKELDRLQEILKVANPHVDFAKGVLAKEWEEIIENRDLVELTEERKTHIVTAFLNEKEIEGAKAFVSENAPKNDGLMNRVLTAEKNQVEMAALEEEKALLQKTIDESGDLSKVSKAMQKMDVVQSELVKLNKSSEL